MSQDLAPPPEHVAKAPPHAAPRQVPPLVTSCPRCEAPAQAASGWQTCGHCKKPFVLVAGALLDGSVVPPAPTPGEVKVKSSGAFTRSLGVVGPMGVSQGTLDPITGHIPMDSLTIPWGDIYSIALWRRPDWVSLGVTSVVLGPIVLGLLVATVKAPAMAILSVPLLALLAWLVSRALRVGVQQMRVCGSRLVLKVRYDQPGRRRKRFVKEAFLRAGIPSPQGCEALSLEA